MTAREPLRRVLTAYARLPFVVRVAAVLAWAAMIWRETSVPGTPGPRGLWHSLWMNTAHVVCFGALAMLVWMGLPDAPEVAVDPSNSPPASRRRRFVLPFVVATGYGMLVEWNQSRIPGRFASAADIASDAIGAGLCLAVCAWLLNGAAVPRRIALALLPAAIVSILLATF